MEYKIKPKNIKEKRPNLPPKIPNYLKNIIKKIDNEIEENSIFGFLYIGLMRARDIIRKETGL